MLKRVKVASDQQQVGAGFDLIVVAMHVRTCGIGVTVTNAGLPARNVTEER